MLENHYYYYYCFLQPHPSFGHKAVAPLAGESGRKRKRKWVCKYKYPLVVYPSILSQVLAATYTEPFVLGTTNSCVNVLFMEMADDWRHNLTRLTVDSSSLANWNDWTRLLVLERTTASPHCRRAPVALTPLNPSQSAQNKHPASWSRPMTTTMPGSLNDDCPTI